MTSVQDLSDNELLLLIFQDSEDAFAVLYGRYFEMINKYIIRYVQSDQLSEDLVQELFIKLWDKRRDLKFVDNIKGYLIVSARNATLNALRSISKSDTALSVLINNYHRNYQYDFNAVLDKEYQDFLEYSLSKLPERTRQIFKECRENGRKYEEVANELGISRNAIKKHMVSAMKVLRSSINSEFKLPIIMIFFLIKEMLKKY